MVKLIILAILIWSFWQPLIASIIFLIFVGLFEGWLFSCQLIGAKRIKTDTKEWTMEEIRVLKKYSAYFLYPFASKSFSSALSGISLSVFIWVPWLFYNQLWIPAILIGANYFLAGPLSAKLNPRFFLHDAVEKRHKIEFEDEMLAVDSVCEKILTKQKEQIKKTKK